MKSLEFISRSALWVLLVAGIAVAGTAAGLTVSTERSRPESALPRVSEPAKTTEAQRPALEEGTNATHHRARPVTRTPDPTPEPSLRIDETIFIRVRREDVGPLTALIRRDIAGSGGRVAQEDPPESPAIDARVAAQYLERIEPLLRRSNHHINPHYAAWAAWSEHNPPQETGGANEVAVSLRVSGRIFDQPEDAVRAGWLFGSGIARWHSQEPSRWA